MFVVSSTPLVMVQSKDTFPVRSPGHNTKIVIYAKLDMKVKHYWSVIQVHLVPFISVHHSHAHSLGRAQHYLKHHVDLDWHKCTALLKCACFTSCTDQTWFIFVNRVLSFRSATQVQSAAWIYVLYHFAFWHLQASCSQCRNMSSIHHMFDSKECSYKEDKIKSRQCKRSHQEKPIWEKLTTGWPQVWAPNLSDLSDLTAWGWPQVTWNYLTDLNWPE